MSPDECTLVPPSLEVDTLDELREPPVVAVALLPPDPAPVTVLEVSPCRLCVRVSTPLEPPPPGMLVEPEMLPPGPTVTELDIPPMLEVED